MILCKFHILKRICYCQFFSLSAACAIEDLDGNNLIITGGSYEPNRVTKYDRNGDAADLATLNNARYYHGCGSYRNTNHQKVLSFSA